jgi:hypothetical protein
VGGLLGAVVMLLRVTDPALQGESRHMLGWLAALRAKVRMSYRDLPGVAVAWQPYRRANFLVPVGVASMPRDAREGWVERGEMKQMGHGIEVGGCNQCRERACCPNAKDKVRRLSVCIHPKEIREIPWLPALLRLGTAALRGRANLCSPGSPRFARK